MLVRGPTLSESMSRYLIQRIESTPAITLRTRTQIDALEGDNGLERIRWRHVDSGARDDCRYSQAPRAAPKQGRAHAP